MGINWHTNIVPEGDAAQKPAEWLRYRTRMEFARWMDENKLSDLEVSEILTLPVHKLRNVLHKSTNTRNFKVVDFHKMYHELSSQRVKSAYPTLSKLNIWYIIFDEKEHPAERLTKELSRMLRQK